jgi:hypothetical protein
MSKGFGKYYGDLPTWAKGVVTVGGIAIIGYITWNEIKKIKVKKDLKEAMKVSNNAKSEANVLQRKGMKASYGETQYESFALKLVEAMNGCGTTIDSVKQVFESMQNKTDVLRLIEFFGVRYYSPCIASSPISYFRSYFDEKAFGGSLQTWLEYDLSSSEIENINNILKGKNIDFKF